MVNFIPKSYLPFAYLFSSEEVETSTIQYVKSESSRERSHCTQKFVYQIGKSTNNALKCLIENIEETFVGKVAFIEIHCGFDSILLSVFSIILLWFLVVDDLLESLYEFCFTTQSYVDNF